MQHSKKDFPALMTIARVAGWSLAVLKRTLFGIGGAALLVVVGLYIAGALVTEPLRWYFVGIASALLVLGGALLVLSYARFVLNRLVQDQIRQVSDLRTRLSDLKKEISDGKKRDIADKHSSDAIDRIHKSRGLLTEALKRLALDDDPAILRQVIEPINNLLLSLQIDQIVSASHAVAIDSDCRVCPGDQAFRVSLPAPKDNRIVTKHLCNQCKHLYSDHLDDLERTMAKYKEAALTKRADTARISRSIEKQKQLMLEAIRHGAIAEGDVLDFGCGGAREASRYLNSLHKNKGLSFYACDIFDADDKNYFRLYRDEHMYYGRFSAIISNAVMEHIASPIDTWLSLNRLLRPIAAGGGIMVHAFPSLINYDLSSSRITADTHVCLYSYDSLKAICERTGFEYITHRYDTGISHHPIFYFKKLRDC